MSSNDKKKIEPFRIIVFVIAVDFIILMWAKKELLTNKSSFLYKADYASISIRSRSAVSNFAPYQCSSSP